jgi:hypothetical protein
MKMKNLASALVLAGAGLVSHSALAADVSNPLQTITLEDNAAFFGSLFTGGNAGSTFTDRFSFTTTSMGDLSAGLVSLSGNDKNGLDITGFSLFDASGSILGGTQLSSGVSDQWSFNYNDLAAGTYYVQVSGSVLSNASGKYYADIALAPVPEPETYGMMLAGLGVVGFMARRRKKTQA